MNKNDMDKNKVKTDSIFDSIANKTTKNAESLNFDSIAIDYEAQAFSYDSIAIGNNATTDSSIHGTITIGTEYGTIFTKDVNGVYELYYKNNVGTIYQLTPIKKEKDLRQTLIDHGLEMLVEIKNQKKGSTVKQQLEIMKFLSSRMCSWANI